MAQIVKQMHTKNALYKEIYYNRFINGWTLRLYRHVATDLVRNNHIEPPWLSGTKVSEAHTFSEGRGNGHKAPSAHPGQTGVHQRTKKGMHIQRERERTYLIAYMQTGWHIQMYICMNIWEWNWMYDTLKNACMYVCMYVFMYVCMYVCIPYMHYALDIIGNCTCAGICRWHQIQPWYAGTYTCLSLYVKGCRDSYLYYTISDQQY